MEVTLGDTESRPGDQTLQLSLWSESGERATLDFRPGTDRGYTVGSARDVDVRLTGARVPYVAFYFERRGSRLWVVPALRGAGLKVESRTIDAPCAIGKKTIIECAKVRLRADVRAIARSSASPSEAFDAPTLLVAMPEAGHDTVEQSCFDAHAPRHGSPTGTLEMECVEATEVGRPVFEGEDPPTLVVVVRSPPAPTDVAARREEPAGVCDRAPESTQIAVKLARAGFAEPRKGLGAWAAAPAILRSILRAACASWERLHPRRRAVYSFAGFAFASLAITAVALVVHHARARSAAVSAPSRSSSRIASSRHPGSPAAESRTPSSLAPGEAPDALPIAGAMAADRGVADSEELASERGLAVQDLVAGRLESARRRYVALAASEPTSPIYAVIARVLERRIAASARATASSLPSFAEAKP